MRTLIAVAVTALVTSAGATAVTQALITTEQIKNGTIRPIDLHPTTRTVLKGQRGVAGPAGVPGAMGAQGAQGLPGGFDPAKITYGVVFNGPVPANNTAFLRAPCPAGSKMIAGGGHTNVGHIYTSIPDPASNSWLVSVQNFSNAQPGFMDVHVVCVLP